MSNSITLSTTKAGINDLLHARLQDSLPLRAICTDKAGSYRGCLPLTRCMACDFPAYSQVNGAFSFYRCPMTLSSSVTSTRYVSYGLKRPSASLGIHSHRTYVSLDPLPCRWVPRVLSISIVALCRLHDIFFQPPSMVIAILPRLFQRSHSAFTTLPIWRIPTFSSSSRVAPLCNHDRAVGIISSIRHLYSKRRFHHFYPNEAICSDDTIEDWHPVIALLYMYRQRGNLKAPGTYTSNDSLQHAR